MTEKEFIEIVEPEEDKKLLELEEFLDGLQSGTVAWITRAEPAQFSGLLEKREITENADPIDLDYLIKTWGGRRLRIKFRDQATNRWVKFFDVPLYSYRPLVYGQPLDIDTPNPHIIQPKKETAEPPGERVNPITEALGIATALNNLKSTDMSPMMELIKAIVSRPAPPPIPQVDPIQSAAAIISLVQQTQGMFQQQQQEPRGENDEVLGMLGKLAEAFTASKKQAVPVPRLTSTQQQPPVVVRRENPDNRSLSDVTSDTLAMMEPSEAIGTLQAALGKMTPEKRGPTFAKIIDSITDVGGGELLLRRLEEKGMLDSGDDDFDDIDETDDSTGSNSRREYGPNGDDDPTDRPSD